MDSCNPNNPAVKRILKEIQELRNDTNPDYKAFPLEDNIFEWHFTIRGPQDSDFNNGIYHGRIILPSEYPFKPPNIVLLTPNGRFETGVKICLTVSAHHPEHWQPSWSIRTVLVALIGFMPTEGKGAIGAIDVPSKERKDLAKKSLDWKCTRCGSDNRTSLPDQIPTTNNTTTTTTTTTTPTTESDDQILNLSNDNINNDQSEEDHDDYNEKLEAEATAKPHMENYFEDLNDDEENDKNEIDEILEPLELSQNITLGSTTSTPNISIPLNTPIGVLTENNNNHNNNNNNNIAHNRNQQKPTTTTQPPTSNTTVTTPPTVQQQPQQQSQQVQQQQVQQRTIFNPSTLQTDRLIVILFTILMALVIKRLFS